MHNLLFRLSSPFSSSFYLIMSNNNRPLYNPLQLNQLQRMSGLQELATRNQPIYLPQSLIIEPEFKIKTQTTQSQQQESTAQLNQQEQHFFTIEYGLERNNIGKRIKTLQYEANNPCEDSLTYGQLTTIDAYTVSVFDGHGGPQLAEYSKQKINNFIDCFLKDNAASNKGKNISEVIKEALKWSYRKLQETFYEIYEQQLKLGNKKIKNVGTCAITAIVHNDKVYIGNSGDSQGIFILSDSKNLIRTEKLNERLNANNRIQRQRIIEKWKDVDEQIVVEESNNSYYLKGRLQPTRTIGDYYLKKQNHFNGQGIFKGPYLSCEPDIQEYQLTQDHKYMVIASDGVWDFLSRNEVMTSLLKQKQIDVNKTYYNEQQPEQAPYLSNILSNILQKSSEVTGKSLQQLKKMQKGKRRNYHDDITIAVVNLCDQV